MNIALYCLQDRFTEFMPWLTKWAGTFVGLTLIAIGLIGIYEAFFEKHEEGHGHAEEEEQAMKLALAGQQGRDGPERHLTGLCGLPAIAASTV
jgi:hypothetical protein